MRMSRMAIALVGAALLLCTTAFAGNNDKGTLKLADKVSVNGTAVNPGNYKVEWNGNGPDVQVTLLQGSHTVTTFPAHLTEQAAASNGDAYESTSQPNGDKSLSAIYFHGKRYSLQLAATTANQNQQTSSNSAK